MTFSQLTGRSWRGMDKGSNAHGETLTATLQVLPENEEELSKRVHQCPCRVGM